MVTNTLNDIQHKQVLMCFANFEITRTAGQFCELEITRGRWKNPVPGPRGEQQDSAEPGVGLWSGLETKAQFQRKDVEVKSALKADLYSWERRIQDLQEQVPINIWQEGKKGLRKMPRISSG